MKNLLDDLGLARGATDRQLDEAIHEASVREHGIVTDPLRLDHYERVHLQYEAIAAAAALLDRDTHRWADRCIEFTPHE